MAISSFEGAVPAIFSFKLWLYVTADDFWLPRWIFFACSTFSVSRDVNDVSECVLKWIDFLRYLALSLALRDNFHPHAILLSGANARENSFLENSNGINCRGSHFTLHWVHCLWSCDYSFFFSKEFLAFSSHTHWFHSCDTTLLDFNNIRKMTISEDVHTVSRNIEEKFVFNFIRYFICFPSQHTQASLAFC